MYQRNTRVGTDYQIPSEALPPLPFLERKRNGLYKRSAREDLALKQQKEELAQPLELQPILQWRTM